MSDDSRVRVGETNVTTEKAASAEPWLEVVGSRYLLDWLAEQRISLAFSTYQTGKLFFVGRKPRAHARDGSYCAPGCTWPAHTLPLTIVTGSAV